MLAGVAIIMLPMFGDFYTAYLLSNGRSSTAMIGNSIQSLLFETTFGYAQARGAALVTVLALFVSMLTLYYILSTARSTQRGGARMSAVGNLLANPWRKHRFLALYTWLYIAWAIVPVVIAIGFSFNAGRSRSVWQGFSLEWWTGNPDLVAVTRPGADLGDPPEPGPRRGHDGDRDPDRRRARARARALARTGRRGRRTS